MKRIAVLPLALGILGSIAASSLAQGPHGRGAGTRIYDSRTVETVNGEVVSVDRIAPANGRSGGVHLTLKTDRETIPVHLGPAWYVDAQKVRVERGDHVEVEGSRVSVEGKPAIIAREVKKGGQTLTLRNAAGVPAWAGRGAGRRRSR
jgi:DNA helicase TIP49 (TBP-interacting protein)